MRIFTTAIFVGIFRCHGDEVGSGSGQMSGQGQGQSQASQKIFNFRGLNASIFNIFFFNWLKLSHTCHFHALECSILKYTGHTVRTTMRTPLRMNMGRCIGDRRHI